MIDIAIECGYECPGSFTRAFKLAFGSNPTLVRDMASRRVASAVADDPPARHAMRSRRSSDASHAIA
ncbi:MAG: hypothetical protein ABW178_11515 [Pseudoxanthomonas sp.]